MQTPRSAQRKGPKNLDTKVLIASLSIAVTVGLWNLFSSEAVLANKTDAKTGQSPTSASAGDAAASGGDGSAVSAADSGSASDGQGLPPLPTLIPVIDLSNTQNVKGGQASPISNQVQSAGLRSVTAPDQVIVQKVKPVFEQGGTVVISGGGGGSSRPAAVTQTRSSHK